MVAHVPPRAEFQEALAHPRPDDHRTRYLLLFRDKLLRVVGLRNPVLHTLLDSELLELCVCHSRPDYHHTR